MRVVFSLNCKGGDPVPHRQEPIRQAAAFGIRTGDTFSRIRWRL